MPRNDQLIRQWYLIAKLAGSHGATLAELAASLPPDHRCHVRTVRRDLEALETYFPPYQEREWHPSQRLELLKGGALKMTLRVADTPELIGWILSFGDGVRVVCPASVRDAVRSEAEKIFSGSDPICHCPELG